MPDEMTIPCGHPSAAAVGANYVIRGESGMSKMAGLVAALAASALMSDCGYGSERRGFVRKSSLSKADQKKRKAKRRTQEQSRKRNR